MLKYPKYGTRKQHDCTYPFPVYQAHWSDGSITRLTFWAPAGKSDAEIAEYGRKMAYGLAKPSIWECAGPCCPAKRLIRGYVEFPGRTGPWYIDTEEEAKPARKRVTKTEWQKTLRRLLAHTNGDTPPELRREVETLLAA